MSQQAENAARAQLLKGLPIRERRIDVNGVATTVLEGWDGPPLVLLHGGIECGGTYWAPVISRLVEGHGVVVPDVPGLGESAPVARLDFKAFADWLEALLGLTCEEPPILVAHSLLGTLAARFSGQRGDLASRLVIYAAPGVGPYRMPIGLRVVAIRFALRPSEPNAERFDRWAFVDLDRARQQDPDWFDAFSAYSRARALVPHVKRTMRQLIRSCTKQVPDDELQRIAVPTTLLWGEHDRFVPIGLAQGASSRLGWPLHLIRDAGHAAHLEHPEAWVSALEEVIRMQK